MTTADETRVQTSASRGQTSVCVVVVFIYVCCTSHTHTHNILLTSRKHRAHPDTTRRQVCCARGVHTKRDWYNTTLVASARAHAKVHIAIWRVWATKSRAVNVCSGRHRQCDDDDDGRYVYKKHIYSISSMRATTSKCCYLCI